jgi:hypothetical protein
LLAPLTLATSSTSTRSWDYWKRISNSDKPIVLAVRPNPEPHDLGSLKLTEGAIAPADPGRVDVVLFIDFLEIGPGWEGLRRNN